MRKVIIGTLGSKPVLAQTQIVSSTLPKEAIRRMAKDFKRRQT